MAQSKRTVTGDDPYVSKIVKYVPAESIALATGFFAAFSALSRAWVFVAVAVFALANFIYLFGVAHVGDARKPDVHFYVLSTLAFLLWAGAAIDAVAAAVGLHGGSGEPQRAWILGVATGFIPLLDSAAKSQSVNDVLRRVTRRKGTVPEELAPTSSTA